VTGDLLPSQAEPGTEQVSSQEIVNAGKKATPAFPLFPMCGRKWSGGEQFSRVLVCTCRSAVFHQIPWKIKDMRICRPDSLLSALFTAAYRQQLAKNLLKISARFILHMFC
jgi:hypothetical protein